MLFFLFFSILSLFLKYQNRISKMTNYIFSLKYWKHKYYLRLFFWKRLFIYEAYCIWSNTLISFTFVHILFLLNSTVGKFFVIFHRKVHPFLWKKILLFSRELVTRSCEFNKINKRKGIRFSSYLFKRFPETHKLNFFK